VLRLGPRELRQASRTGTRDRETLQQPFRHWPRRPDSRAAAEARADAGSEDWASAGEPGQPISVDGITIGLLICADAYRTLPALLLRDSGAQLLISAAAWWPGDWGPKGEWEARTLDTGLPMIVCNRTGRDHESRLFGSESVVVDRGEKLLKLRAPKSTVFIVDCQFSDGHIARCKLTESTVLRPH
jgi:predicted amidohydrolase